MTFILSPIKVLAMLSILGIVGCATQVTEKPVEIKRSTVPFSEFKKVILVKSEIRKPYAGQAANIKAANKIDEILAGQIKSMFDQVEVVSYQEYEKNGISATTPKDTLVIRPIVKQIKFIGGAARFWAGAMAGSSVVIMDVNCIDAATKEIIGQAGYYRKAGAYSDPFGVGSNLMLNDIAIDISNYINNNK